MSPENPLLFRQKAPSQIIDWALNTPMEYQKLLHTNVQGTVHTYAKIKSMRRLIWSKSKSSYSEMFRQKAVLRFLGKHAWRRTLLSRCTASSLERYYKKTLSNIFSCDLFEITCNFYSTREMTAISCPLSYDVVYHCQLILINQYISIWYLWYRISFSFLVGSFFHS